MLQNISENIIGIMCTLVMTSAVGVITHLFKQFRGLSQAVMAINHDPPLSGLHLFHFDWRDHHRRTQKS